MKKICRTLLEKGPFKILINFFFHLPEKVHIFDLILIRINPIKNEENPSNIMGKGAF